MTQPASVQIATRLLLATTFLLVVALAIPSCTDNAGALFGGGGDPGGGGGGGGGGGTPAADPVAPVAGAVIIDGAPELVAFYPADKSTDVDVKTPLGLWFSESLDLNQVSSDSIRLRISGGASSLSFSVSSFNGDRGFVLNPVADLNADTEYEVFVTEDLVDISGERLKVGSGEVIAKFTTAATATGIAPQIIGSFPPDTSVEQSNTYSLVLLFSKPIDFLGVSAAVSISAPGGVGDFGVPVISNSEQVVEFPHQDSANDLGINIGVDVLDTIVDLEAGVQLASTYSASWDSLNFAPATSIGTNGELFVNLANYSAFPSNINLGASSLTGDVVKLEIWDTFGLNHIADASSSVVDGVTTVAFNADLGDAVLGFPAFADGPLTIAAWVERSGTSSTVEILSTIIQDTNPPVLSQMGPPFTGVSTRMSTDLSNVRPYGKASEPILTVDITYPLGGATSSRSAGPSGDGFFIGNHFDPGVADGAIAEFEIRLTDLAGNQMDDPVKCTAYRRGFVGAQVSTGDLTVEVVDAQSLAPLPGATIYLEDFQSAFTAAGLRNEDSGATGSDGRNSFSGRVGLQTITVIMAGYHPFTLLGSTADFVSIPLRPEVWDSVTVSPSITGGLSGEVTFASGMFSDNPGERLPSGLIDASLPLAFNSYAVIPDRPGWFAGFHEVAEYGGGGTTYYDLFSLEPRFLVDAPSSSGGSTVIPTLSFGSTTNATNATTNSIWSFQVAPSLGYNGPRSDGAITTTSSIPGIQGNAITGVGAISGVNAEAEMELALHLAAVNEGALSSTSRCQIFVVDDDGDQSLTRYSVTGDLETAVVNGQAISFAGISESTPPTNSAGAGSLVWPDIELTFPDVLDDTIDGSEDWYHLTLVDSDTPASEWDIWLNADSDSVAESVILPALAPASGTSSDGSPLLTTPGSTWTLAVSAFNLDSTKFPSANGTFFAALFRDCDSWSTSVPGTPFNVQ